jgi:hypothetical protein
MKYILFLLSIVTIPGCADRRSTGEVQAMMIPPPAISYDTNYAVAETPEATVDEIVAVDFDAVQYSPPKLTAPVTINERKLIKTGGITFEVNDIEATKKSIISLVKNAGGYTSSENEKHGYDYPQFEQVVRIPSDKLDDFVLKITSLAKRIISKSISTKDVTEEFIDIETRLVTKKDLEKNYREILRKATTVKEMLEVERELEDVRGEIESMEGRLQYLKSQVAFSTLRLTYLQVTPVVDETGFGDKVAMSLGNGWFNVVEFTLEVLTAWPIITIGSIAGLLMYLRVRSWMRRRRIPITNNQ